MEIKKLLIRARLPIVIAIVVGFIWLLAFGFTRDPRYIRSPLIGQPAPAFNLLLFEGGTIRFEELKGKTVLINFWASWCPPCRAEAPALEAAWKTFKEGNVVFVGVNIQDKEEDARAFIKEFDITYRNGWDSTGRVAVNYGVWGIPETFFLDREGRITFKHVGALSMPVITAKLDQAVRGIVSAEEGRGEYQSVR